MNKEDAIRIITSCAKEYHSQLENRNLLFVFGSKNKTEYLETVFQPKNFLHLTGIELTSAAFSGSSDFYEKCLKGQLRLDNFNFARNGTTQMKLQVLPQLMQIQRIAKMVGDFNFSKSLLVTEKLAGNVMACMGFVRDDTYYVPNTVLKEDIRDITDRPQQRVLAIYKKSIDEPLYLHLTYLAKGIDHNNLILTKEIINKISPGNIITDFASATKSNKVASQETISNENIESTIQSPKLEKEHVVFNHILMSQTSEQSSQEIKANGKNPDPER